jgi:co-chaperonin GroES (HSP10)
MHKSGLRPLGHAVLVESYDPDESQRVLIIPESAKQGMKSIETRATVVAVGDAAWHEEIQQGYPPRAVVGDKVLLANYSGVLVTGPKDGKIYRMVNDRDIYCQFEDKDNG